MSAADSTPSVHGGEQTPPVRPQPTWAEVEALAALLEPEAFDSSQQASEVWRKVTQNKALAHAAAVLAAGYVRAEQPELITLPTFNGCTDTNPDFCACNEGAVCCDACGDEIDEGAEVWALTRPLHPWAAAEGAGQEFENLLWHTTCDLRGSVSGVGNATK